VQQRGSADGDDDEAGENEGVEQQARRTVSERDEERKNASNDGGGNSTATVDYNRDADNEEGEGAEQLPNTNNSHDEDAPGIPVRVTIPPLLLRLSPTTEALTAQQVRLIHDMAESTIESYLVLLNSDDRNALEDGIIFSYLSLLGVTMDQWVGSTGQSYCGTNFMDAGDTCVQPCTYGSLNDADGCPSGQLCYANVMSCPAADNNNDRKLRGGATARQSGRGLLADDTYTVIQLAGGLANFRVVSPATAPSEKRLGRLAAKGIEKNLSPALQELDDPVLAGIDAVTTSVLLAGSESSAFGISDESVEGEDQEGSPVLDEPPVDNPQPPPSTTDGIPPIADTTLDEATPSSIPPASIPEETPSEDIPPVLRDPPSENSGTIMPGVPSGQGIVGGETAVHAKTVETSSTKTTPLVAGVVTGMVLLTIALVVSVLFIRKKRRTRSKNDARRVQFQPQRDDSDLKDSGERLDSAASRPLAMMMSRPLPMDSIKEIDEKGANDEKEDTDESSSDTVNAQHKHEELVSPAQLNNNLVPKSRTRFAASSAARTGEQQQQMFEDDVSIGETTVSHTDTSLGNGSPIKPSDSFEIRRHFESITLRKDMMVPAVAAGMESRDPSRVRIVNTEMGRMPRNVDVEDKGNLITYPRHLKTSKPLKQQM